MLADRFENFTPEEWAKIINSNPYLYLVIFLHFSKDGNVYSISGLKRAPVSWAIFFGEISAVQEGDYFTALDLKVLYDDPRSNPDIASMAMKLSELARSPYGQALIAAGGRKGLLLKAFEKGVSRLAFFILVGSRLVLERKYFPRHKIRLFSGTDLLDFLASRVYIAPSVDETERYYFTKQIHDALMKLMGIVRDNPLKRWKLSFQERLKQILSENGLERPEEIVEFFMYENMRRRYPDFCQYYKSGEICHKNMKKENFNCFFCGCPEFYASYYNVSEKQFGKCLLGSKKGKYDETGHWDCSDCSFVHYPKYVLRFLREKPWYFDLSSK